MIDRLPEGIFRFPDQLLRVEGVPTRKMKHAQLPDPGFPCEESGLF